MNQKSEKTDTTPRTVPFMTDKARTASDMLLVIAHNLTSAVSGLIELTDKVQKMIEQEECSRLNPTFRFSFELPRTAEWRKTENKEATKEEEPTPKVETPKDAAPSREETGGISDGNPSKTE